MVDRLVCSQGGGHVASWISNQPELVRHWISYSDAPLVVSGPKGEIYWCNHAFEKLVGYSRAELTSGQIGWDALTPSDADTSADLALAAETAAGERMEYWFRKEYDPKLGDPVPVQIHCLRYPPFGSFQCFLVTVFPLSLSETERFKRLNQLKAEEDKIKTMSDTNQADIRRAVRDYLAARPHNAQAADTILRGIVREGITASQNDVLDALAFWLTSSPSQLTSTVDPVGSKKYYQITAAGSLAFERGE